MIMDNWLNGEFPELLGQEEDQQLGNSWDKKRQQDASDVSTSYFKEAKTASSSSLASAKVFDVEAEVSTMNRAEAH